MTSEPSAEKQDDLRLYRNAIERGIGGYLGPKIAEAIDDTLAELDAFRTELAAATARAERAERELRVRRMRDYNRALESLMQPIDINDTAKGLLIDFVDADLKRQLKELFYKQPAAAEPAGEGKTT